MLLIPSHLVEIGTPRNISNDISFSVLKGTFSVALRKKRGRTAPPSSRCLRGKKDDKVMDSDDAINNLNHACNVQATAVKNTTAVDKNAQAILDDVSFYLLILFFS
jgi:hypothetical protein